MTMEPSPANDANTSVFNERALELEEVGPDTYLSVDLWKPKGNRGVFGGQVIGQALSAAAKTVDSPYRCNSIHCYFLAPGDNTEMIAYEVRRVRQGRSFCSRLVSAKQKGRVIFIATVSFQSPEASSLSHQYAMPKAPAPETLISREEYVRRAQKRSDKKRFDDDQLSEVGMQPIETRYVPTPKEERGLPTRMLWLRAKGDMSGLGHCHHQSMLAYASDIGLIGTALRPFQMDRPGAKRKLGMLVSLDHTIWFHEPFRADEWLLYFYIAPISQISHLAPMIPASSFIKRGVQRGPEKPAAIMNEFISHIRTLAWKHEVTYALSGCASGLVVAFLIGVFIWRRSLVNRISLRIMFAISVLDFMTNVVQIRVPSSAKFGAGCRVYNFFVYFGMYTSVYLSSSIAANLYMVFLRKNRSPVPRYVELLYFVVPAAVGFLHFMPQQIWSATHGLCTPFTAIIQGTTKYIVYVTFVFLFLPWLFILFNLVICSWVIISLLIKQGQVNRTLKQIRERSSLLPYECDQSVGGSELSGTKTEIVKTREYERQLKISRKVNSAAIRIALYPLAPLAWMIMVTIYFVTQYYITFTYKSDAPKMVKAAQISWYSYPATTFLNFIIFLTDPVMQNVIGEVRRSIATKLSKKSGLSKIDTQKKRGLGISTESSTKINNSTAANMLYGSDTCSDLSVSTEEKQYKLSHADTLAELEEDSHHLLDALGTYDDTKLKQL
ncbi:acyl-CoA thioesterase [Dipsacomyces acuminosporus]|nr:acyl-CoA thioesterase [Dipsacomyces acuminosporus]